MVKSKKMSKTGIAVIVLAILLVLSLVMGMTGAWYTNSAKSTPGEGQSGTFVLAGWLECSFSGAEDAEFEVRRVTGAASMTNAQLEEKFTTDGQYEVISGSNGTYTVLPGDRIYYDVGAGESLTVTAAVDYWYMTYSNGAWSALQVGTAGNGVTLTSSRAESATGSVVSHGDPIDYYEIDHTLAYTSTGASAGTFSIADGDQLAFIAVQRANVDSETATTILNGMKAAALAD